MSRVPPPAAGGVDEKLAQTPQWWLVAKGDQLINNWVINKPWSRVKFSVGIGQLAEVIHWKDHK